MNELSWNIEALGSSFRDFPLGWRFREWCPGPQSLLDVIMAPPGGCSMLTVSTQCLLLSGTKDSILCLEGEGVEWGGCVVPENSSCPPEKPAFLLALRTQLGKDPYSLHFFPFPQMTL